MSKHTSNARPETVRETIEAQLLREDVAAGIIPTPGASREVRLVWIQQTADILAAHFMADQARRDSWKKAIEDALRYNPDDSEYLKDCRSLYAAAAKTLDRSRRQAGTVYREARVLLPAAIADAEIIMDLPDVMTADQHRQAKREWRSIGNAAVLALQSDAIASQSKARAPEAAGTIPAAQHGDDSTRETMAGNEPSLHDRSRLSCRELAEKYHVPQNALYKRLQRWRRVHGVGFVEDENKPKNEPGYVYEVQAVRLEIIALQHAEKIKAARQTGGRRK